MFLLREIDISSFICNELIITFKGFDAHPGEAGKNLLPAQYGAAEFICELEKLPTPFISLPFSKLFRKGRI